MAKEFLSRNNIAFTDFDVGADKDARQEMVKKSGQYGVPVILVDGEVTVGFNKAHLEQVLGLGKK